MTLALNDRLLLLDALRPPAGMELDAAVGTSFTLDLAALLAIPVSASVREGGEESAVEGADVLETIRRHAQSTVLFCQAGAISVPPRYRPAMTFVEQTVVEVRRPTGGLFHPKTWVVRFATPSGAQHHRVLVMSRNLTFDRSWDVIVSLDEVPSARERCDVRGMVRFLRFLPTEARDLAPAQSELLKDVTTTLSKACLGVPDGFLRASFVPLGIGRGGSWPFHDSCDHALAVSPFLGGTAPRRFLASAKSWAGVVARPESLDAAQAHVGDAFPFRIKPSVISAEEATEDELSATDQGTSDGGALRGLHAKFYVQDRGDSSTVWFGSANLTQAAFAPNVEMLVQLTGDRRLVGVDALVGWNDKKRLSSLIEPHDYRAARDDDPEEGLSAFAALGYSLASASVTLHLAKTKTDELWNAHLTLGWTDWPVAVEVHARMLSLDSWQAVLSGTAEWTGVPLTKLTPFVVIRMVSDEHAHQLLVRAQLSGDPPHRRAAVLAAAINSREDFLRYLASLLRGGEHLMLDSAAAGDASSAPWLRSMGADRVLEDLMTTASRTPQRLTALDTILAELAKTEAGRAIVPAEFWSLWESVRVAARNVRS